MKKGLDKPVSFYFNSVLIILAVIVVGFFLFYPAAGSNLNNYFFGAGQTSISALIQNNNSFAESGSGDSGNSYSAGSDAPNGKDNGGSTRSEDGVTNVLDNSADLPNLSNEEATISDSCNNDGVYDIGEFCDNGGVNGDGCSDTCEIESGWVCFGFPGDTSECIVDDQGSIQGGEEFSGSEANDFAVPSGDSLEVNKGSGGSWECGDGTQVVPREQCDDGNTLTEQCPYSFNQKSCTVCSSACTLIAGTMRYCGDGVVNGAESCDDGKDGCNTDACTDSCTIGAGSDECSGNQEAFFAQLFKNFQSSFSNPHAVLSEENEVTNNGLIIPVLIVIVLLVVWFARAKPVTKSFNVF